MYALKRVLVGLDLTPMDDTLIAYTRFLCDQLDIGHLYFFHAERSLQWDVEISGDQEAVMEPLDETLKQQMQERVRQTFADLPIEVHIEVVEGDPSREVLHWSQIKQVDLVILGKKKLEHGQGVVPDRISRKAPCAVLIVPEDVPVKLEHVLIPIDFSPYSDMALDVVAEFSVKTLSMRVIALVVTKVPTGFYTTGKSYEEFSTLIQNNAHEKLRKFIAKSSAAQLDVKPVIVVEDKKAVGDVIHDVAGQEGADLIIVGSKGQSAASVLLLGSVTERLIRRSDKIPALIVKKKGETLGFLDALLRV